MTNTTKDSLSFNFSTSVFKQVLTSTDINLNSTYFNNSTNKSIAKKDIIYLKDYTSKKNKKLRKTLSAVGGLLVLSGIATSINALLFADNNKNDLLIASGIQFGIGLIIGFSSSKKRKELTGVSDPWIIN